MTKETIQSVLDEIDGDVDIDEFTERLRLIEEIELARRDVEAGRLVPHEEVERRFAATYRKAAFGMS